MLLLDTHILIWLDQGAELLGKKARQLIENAYHREEIAVAPISFWEVGMLVSSGRLLFSGDLSEWRASLLNTGFTEIPADGAVSLVGSSLKNFAGDPADRLIAATAMASEARLVTADNNLLELRGLKTVSGLK